MTPKTFAPPIPSLVYALGTGLWAVAIPLHQRSLMTMGMALTVLAAGLHLARGGGIGADGWRGVRPAWPFVWLCATAVLGGLYTQSAEGWLRDVGLKLPLLLLPLAWGVLRPLGRREVAGLLTLVACATAGVALGSVGHFWLHRAELLAAIAQNKSIPIVSGANHIYFSLLQALCVFGGAWVLGGLWRGGAVGVGMGLGWRRGWAVLAGAATLANVLTVHVLSGRTGLVALYAGAAVAVGMLAVQRRWYWQAALALGGLSALPVVAYEVAPSFRERVNVSRWDWAQYRERKGDLSYLSIGTRLLAWEAAWAVFEGQPLLGTGMGDLPGAMRAHYDTHPQPVSRPEMLLETTHNQYMEHLAGGGLLGLGCLLWALGAAGLRAVRGRSAAGAALVAGVGAGMLTEAILDRQVGVALLLLAVWALWNATPQPPASLQR